MALPSANLFWLAVLGWAAGSAAYVMGNGPFLALLQSSVPTRLQGRVLSLLNTLTGVAAPLGLALATPLGEVIGPRWLFVTLGVLGGLIVLLGFLSPTLRQADDQEPGAAQPALTP